MIERRPSEGCDCPQCGRSLSAKSADLLADDGCVFCGGDDE